ncbi:hypothetical protein CD934_17100 [Streptomyces calvus]|uniref:Uncharacterized protein n=1 Tax=Streptomyces calvus TaxID=67282 RepID=A0A514JS84_9ACTN|nr:hypothetical protein CD934_17100 [Streptomyces calvus]
MREKGPTGGDRRGAEGRGAGPPGGGEAPDDRRHFRLCFDAAGRLAAKDVVPRVGLSREGPEEHEEFAP